MKMRGGCWLLFTTEKHRQNPLSPPSGGYGLLMTFVKSKGGKRKSGLGGVGVGELSFRRNPSLVWILSSAIHYPSASLNWRCPPTGFSC